MILCPIEGVILNHIPNNPQRTINSSNDTWVLTLERNSDRISETILHSRDHNYNADPIHTDLSNYDK